MVSDSALACSRPYAPTGAMRNDDDDDDSALAYSDMIKRDEDMGDKSHHPWN